MFFPFLRSFIILFLIKIESTNSISTPLWTLSEIGIPISTSEKHTISSAISENEIIYTYYDTATQKNILQIGQKTKEITFDGVDSFARFDNIYYICPSNINYTLFSYNADTEELLNLGYPKNIQDQVGKTLGDFRTHCLKREPGNMVIVVFEKTSICAFFLHSNKAWSDSDIINKPNLISLSIDSNKKTNSQGAEPYYYQTYTFFIESNYLKAMVGELVIYEGSTQFNSINIRNAYNKEVLANTKIYFKTSNDPLSFDAFIITYNSNKYCIYHSSVSDFQNHDFVFDNSNYYLPVEINEGNYVIKSFDFINESQYYYYQIQAISSGTIYYGIGDFLSNVTLFHSNNPYIQITPYSNFDSSILVRTETGSYFVCPFESSDSPLSCNKCTSKILLLNPNGKNICIDSNNNITIINNSIATCNVDFVYKNGNCLRCQDITGYYKLIPEGGCSEKCDESIHSQKNDTMECISCWKSTNPFLLKDNNSCVETKETNTFYVNEDFKIIQKCNSKCATCETNADNCLTCTGNYGKPSDNSNDCVETSTNQFEGIDKRNASDQKFVNCADINLVRYLSGSDLSCIEKPSTGVYVVPIENTGNVNYSIIGTCYTSCETCSEKGDDTDNKCESCATGYLEGTNCVSTCSDPNYYQNNKKCINCMTLGNYYKYEGLDQECLSPQPDGTFVVNDSFHIIKNCNSNCSTCSEISDDPLIQKCTKCKATSSYPYLNIDGNCVTECDDNYYQNEEEKKCIKCSEKGLFKYYGKNNECIERPTDIPVYDYEGGNGVIGQCHSNCSECQKGGNDSNDNCDKCKSGLVLTKNNNCDLSCGDDKLYKDTENRICVNCKVEKVDTPYKLLGESNPCIAEPADKRFYKDNSYFDTHGIIGYCGNSCKTCDEGPTDTNDNCKTCENGKYLDAVSKSCVDKCSGYYGVGNDGINCVNCYSLTPNQYKYENEVMCIPLPDQTTSPTYIKNTTFGIIVNCHQNCQECDGEPTETPLNHHCTSCKGVLQLVNQNCISQCDDIDKGIYQGNCIICSEKGKVKYEDSSLCIDLPDQSTQPTYYVNEEKGIINNCYSTCASCEGSGSNSNHNCKSCSGSLYLLGTNCVSSCGASLGKYETNNTCVNCKNFSPEKYKKEGDNIPCSDNKDGYYLDLDNTDYNIIKPCSTDCAECDIISTNCTACKPGQFLQYKGNTCAASCDEYTIMSNDNKCINCKDKSEYRYMENTTSCISLPENQAVYYINKEYNIIANCDSSCSSCSITSTNCTDCELGKYLSYEGNLCDTTCTINYGINAQERKCENCFEKGLYKRTDNDYCVTIESLNGNAYILKNGSLNLIEVCYSSCASCSAKEESESKQNCLSCKNGYYLQPENGPTNCLTTCPDTRYILDNVNHICLNCQKDTKYRYPSNNTCPYNSIPANSFLVDSYFNIINECDVSCNGCETSASNCKVCANGYYAQADNQFSCLNHCNDINLAKDDTLHQCVNCLLQKKFKYQNEEYCIASSDPNGIIPPEGTYIINTSYNIIANCYITCKTCNSLGTDNNHQCNSCKTGYELDSNNNCIPLCVSPYKWYYDSISSLICLNGANCPENRPYLIEETYQCVESCLPSGTCELCKNKNLYLYQEKCVEECPQGTQKNESMRICDNTSILYENGCTLTVINDQTEQLVLSNASINSEFNTEIFNYLESLDKQNVRIIKKDGATLSIFSNSSCGSYLLPQNNLIYTNLSLCIETIKESNSSIIDVIVGEIDIERKNEKTNQAGYILTDQNGRLLDLSVCGKTKIATYYPLDASQLISFARSSKFSEMNIDLDNPKDPFFNDYCFPYSEEGKDVVIKDRREQFFQNNSLCEEGCDYYNLDFKTSQIRCDCEPKQSPFDKITENIPFDDFPSGFNMNNLVIIKCYNLVFDMQRCKKNYGSWLMISLFVLQIPVMVSFFIIGLSPLYSYLNQFSVKAIEQHSNDDNILPSNPPKKNISISSENEEEEEEEEEEREEEETEKSVNDSNLEKKENINTNISYKIPNKTRLPIIDKMEKDGKNTLNNNFIPLPTSSPSLSPHAPGVKLVQDLNYSKITLHRGNIENEEDDELEQFDDEELDELVYEDALQYDKRCICKFYLRILKNNLVIISVFTNISVMEPFCIKILAFLLNIAVYFVLNAMLFDQSYISKRYEEKDSTGFAYLLENEIPRCMYASFASLLVDFLIKYLSSSRKRFETLIKREKEEKQFLIESKQILRDMKWKFFVFITLDIILMGFFWYYVSAFCAVYKYSQVPWIEGSLITFIFCIIIYSILYLFVTIFRYIGLKCHITCFYTLSTYFI